MDLKQKLANAKKKIKENRALTDTLIVTGCLAATVYSFCVLKKINELTEDMERADAVIRNINDGARHVQETGHSVTFYNSKGEPVFVMSASED